MQLEVRVPPGMPHTKDFLYFSWASTEDCINIKREIDDLNTRRYL